MTYEYKEVDFAKYCPLCKFKDISDVKDPCNNCLAEPKNLHSEKPVEWKEQTR